MEKDLKKIANRFREVSKKIKLVSLLKKAKDEYNQNNDLGCMDACQKTLVLDAKNAVALRGLGCVMQSRGEYDKAIKYYKKALEKSKTKEIEYTLIGTIYYIQENLEEAIRYYNLAIENNDDYDLAYEGRNQSLLEKHLKILDLQDELIKREIF